MSGKRRAPASSMRGQTRAARPPVSRRKRLLRWALILTLAGALVSAGTFFVLYQVTDLPDPNREYEIETSFVYYAGGEGELGRFAADQVRTSVSYNDIPQHLKDAVVAIENRSFWTDKGIDPKGIIRAAFNNAQGGPMQGASTITQQYVKVLYLTQERSYTRKVKEAILSLKLQQEMSKQEVLTGYLNTIYFGRGAYGVQAAAKAYFGVDAKDLDLRQSAVLASIIQNPSIYDPKDGRDARDRLRERYERVLELMAEDSMVTTEEAARAMQRLPKFPPTRGESTNGGQKGHVLGMVRAELMRLGFSEQEIAGGGLRVTTTFSPKAMRAAEEGVREARPEGFSEKDLHVGVASVEPGTGAVRSIYGGQDYLKSQINWAVSGGQAGSSLKPFALATALEEGFSLRDTFEGNSPIELPDGTEIENQGDTDYGSAVDLVKATEDSVNTAYIDLTMSLENGPEKIIATMNEMGIPPVRARAQVRGFPNRTPGLEPVTSVALGSATVSPINMANAYATIAAEGVYAEPYIIEKVVDANGTTVYDHKPRTRRVLDADIAADVSYALQQVVESGSGTTALGLGRPAAGKTGTSTNGLGDVVSSWFTGYTPQLVTSVVYTRGKGIGKLDEWLPCFFGSCYPADTWLGVMTRAMEGVEVEDFPEPAWVDGEAPEEGHAPTPPPAPRPTVQPRPAKEPSPTSSPSPTKRPTPRPTQTPTQEPSPPPPPPSSTTTSPPPPSTPPPSETDPGCSQIPTPSGCPQG